MTYIARYSDGGGDPFLLQHLVSFPIAVLESPQAPISWWEGYRRVANQLVSAPGIEFAIRVSLHDRRFERLVVMLGHSEQEQEIIALGAAFMGLNSIVEHSVSVPAEAKAHNDLAEAFPPVRARVRQGGWDERDAWLIDDPRLASALPDLLDVALTLGFSFAYQLNVCRRRAGAEELRLSRYNLLRLAEARLPSTVLTAQEHAVRRLEQAVFLMEEFVGSVSREAMRRLNFSALEQIARPRGFPETVLLPAPVDTVARSIAMGLHSARAERPGTWHEVAAAAALRDDVQSVLHWQPQPAFLQAIDNVAHGAAQATDYLNRIEQRLAAIDRELARRNLKSEPSECEAFRTALKHAAIEPMNSLMHARQILENIVSVIYRDHLGGRESGMLFGKLKELLDEKRPKIFPKQIESYLQTVRVLGNLVVHNGKVSGLSAIDVEITLLALLQVVGWYVLEYQTPERPNGRGES